VDAAALGLIGGRAARERPSAERSLAAARWRGRRRAGTGRDGGEVHREDGQFALDVGAELGLLLADVEVSLGVGNNRRAKEPFPPGSGHRQGGDDHRPGSVRPCLDHKGVEQRWWREGEERLAVDAAAGRAGRAGPVGDGEGVLSLRGGLCVPRKEARQHAVGRGSEGVQVNGQGPAAGGGQRQGATADKAGADRSRNLECTGARVVVDAFVDQDPTRCRVRGA
jgi:hypothetical protein